MMGFDLQVFIQDLTWLVNNCSVCSSPIVCKVSSLSIFQLSNVYARKVATTL
jgi:hypothetical protein